MKTLHKTFARFERMMDKKKIYRAADLTFGQVCAKLGTDRNSFDSFLMEELGYTGQQIIERYRYWEQNSI